MPASCRSRAPIAAITLLLGLVLTSCAAPSPGPEVKPPGNEQVEKSQNDILLENIANRPAEGTPEYNELFAPYAVPYIEGQPLEEVVLNITQSTINYIGMGIKDAPDNVTKWQIETEKSALDLADDLDLEYYDKGFLSQIVEPEILDSMMNGYIPTRNRSYVANAAIDNVLEDKEITITNYGFTYTSPTNFTASPTAIKTLDGRDAGSYTFSARAVDTDGNGTLDSWRIYSSSMQG